MKTTLFTVALLLVLSLGSQAVQVQENGFSFPLEAVRKLQVLSESSAVENQSPRLRASSVSVCADPNLPVEFLPLCQQPTATASISRLVSIPIDVCEICSYAACTGC